MNAVLTTGAVNNSTQLDESQIGRINLPSNILDDIPDIINLTFTVHSESTLFPVRNEEGNITIGSCVLGASIPNVITSSVNSPVSLLFQLNDNILNMVRLSYLPTLYVRKIVGYTSQYNIIIIIYK